MSYGYQGEKIGGYRIRLIDKVFIIFRMIKAKYRAFLGFCPMCNSDAPELDDCPLCASYHTSRGDKWPPPKRLTERWLREYKMTLLVSKNVKRLVSKHRSRNGIGTASNNDK